MKKTLALALAAVMAVSLAACGGGSSSGGSSSGGGSSSSSGEIRLVNNKVEIDEGLKKLAAKYEEETGVKVNIESLGGGVDTQATLKGYYQAGNMPDIFVFEGDKDYPTWEGNLADLSDMACMADTDSEYEADGVAYGFPTTTEAIGLAYNKSILDAAGIDPASITGPESMKAAFETLDAKKDELGLTAVVGWYTEPSALYWTTGQHMFGTYLDEGLARDDTTYFDLLTDGGKLDLDRAKAWGEMVALFNQYSDQANMVSGTYDQQILNFASGKYAFVTQGSWIGATMTSADAEQYAAAGNFAVGMVPYAFDDGIDTIQTNSPSWWAVYDGKNKDAAKAFLAWCAGDEGQQILVEKAGFISPFKSCKYTASDPFAKTIADYVAAGKTSAWHWLNNKEGLAQNYLGQVFADFAGGKMDVDKFVDVMKQQVKAAYSN